MNVEVTDSQPQPEAESLEALSFPVDALPQPIQQFVAETATALCAAPDLVALPALVSAGAAIGNARRIRVKEGWTESAALYGAIVTDSGKMKSPALEAATAPVKRHQSKTRRTWISDVTVERLATLLEQNPRGLLVCRDELSGWVKGLNQYKVGKGADREFYLSAHGGQPYAVDRQIGTQIVLARPFVSVVGGLPPDVLPDLAGQLGKADGFLERILFAWPDRCRFAGPISSSRQRCRSATTRCLTPSTRSLMKVIPSA